eukprot:gene12059-14249_t
MEVSATGAAYATKSWQVKRDANGRLLFRTVLADVWDGKQINLAGLDGYTNMVGFMDATFNTGYLVPLNVSILEGGPLIETCSGHGFCQSEGVPESLCVCDDGFLGASCEESERPPTVSYLRSNGGEQGDIIDGDAGEVAEDGSADAPFPNLRHALTVSDASQPRMLMLLPGRYIGQGNRELDFASVGEEGNTEGQFSLPASKLIFNSTHGAEVTVVDCQGDTYFMKFRSSYVWNTEVTMERITMHACTLRADSGEVIAPLAFQFAGSKVLLRDMVFDQNVGLRLGGALFFRKSAHVKVLRCRFTNNRVYGASSSALPGGKGGGLYAETSTLLISNSEFWDNWAESLGGAMEFSGSSNSMAILEMENVLLVGNVAELAGG